VSTTLPPTSPWEKYGWAFAAIWLVFLVYPVVAVFDSTDGLATVLGLVLVAGFAAVYMLGFGPLQCRPWLVLALLTAIAGGLVPIIGVEAVGLTPYLGVHSALQVPSPWWPRTTAVVAALPLLAVFSDGEFPVYFFLMVWPILIGMSVLRIFTDREQLAARARAEHALLAERERVARDVHDVLGHSLTALSVKAELAARLVDLDPARAKEELESIQATARQALAEVRATVGGLRAGNLEAELAAAPRVLADAGIATTVRGAVADTDPRHRALLAWVLRESVTNVVRHARADSVVIELGPHGITVTDDGAGVSGPEGNGLRGMRERVSGAGGTLGVVPATPGTRIEVAIP
jgi:two-component system, NarL family, sensor histidine kinase DesK